MEHPDYALMQSCPRWERCNAPVCPAGPAGLTGAHLRGEPVCFWLREWSKTGGAERVAAALPAQTDLVAAIRDGYEAIRTAGLTPQGRWREISKVLSKSAESGSMLAAGERLKALRKASTGA